MLPTVLLVSVVSVCVVVVVGIRNLRMSVCIRPVIASWVGACPWLPLFVCIFAPPLLLISTYFC